MALDLGELSIKVTANTEALSKASSAFNKLQKPLEELNKSIRVLEKTVDKLSSKMSSDFTKMAQVAISSADKVKQNQGYVEFFGRINKSAKESAAVFQQAFKEQEMEVAALKKRVDGLGNSFVNAGTRAKGASNRLSGTTSKVRNLGYGVQNAAYQFQDMIVQFEMGIDTSRIMAQQLPQLLGGFGILGSVAGFAAAALATFIPKLFNSGEEASNAANKIDIYRDSLDVLKNITDGLEESQARLNGTMREFELKSLKAVVTESQNNIQRIKDDLMSLADAQTDVEGFSYDFLVSRSKELKEAEEQLAKAKEDLATATKNQRQTTLNNIQTDLNQYNKLVALAKQYKKGAIGLKEYNIQKELYEEISRKGIQTDEKAQKLLRQQIEARYKLKDLEDSFKPKDTTKEIKKSANDIKDLIRVSEEATYRFEALRDGGLAAGIAAEKAAKSSATYIEILREMTALEPDNLRAIAKELGIIGAKTKPLSALVKEVTYKWIEYESATKKANAASEILKKTITETDTLLRQISAIKEVSLGDIVAGPDAVKKVIEFSTIYQDILARLKQETAGEAGIKALSAELERWKTVAESIGKLDLLEEVDPTDLEAVAKAIAKIKQEAADFGAGREAVSQFIDNLKEEAKTVVMSEKALMLYNLQKEYTKNFTIELNEEQQKELDLLKQQALAYDENAKAAKRAADAGKQMGEAIGSALENAIVEGESFSDVLKALEQDILRVFVNQFISTPISNALGDMFGQSMQGGSNILGNMFGSLFSFAGGGFTGYGSRSGGIDGQGGFPAILHPNETIVDHTKNNNDNQGQTIIQFNVTTQDANSFKQSQYQISQDLRRVVTGAGL